MIIERVELENVLSHRKSTIDLGKGIIAIVGPNGAGKSSIIDAISYAFFGTHSRDPRNKKETIIRLGAHYARIIIDFISNGRYYRIQKTISRHGRTDTKLIEIIDGKPAVIATSPSTVASELRKIIGIDPQIAEKLIITRQGQIEEILINKDKRIELIDTILRLKAVEKAFDRIADITRTARKILQDRERLLQREKQRLEVLRSEIAKSREIEEALARKKPLLHEKEQRLSALKSELDESTGRLISLEKTIEMIENKKKDLEVLIKDLEAVEKELAEARKASIRLEELKKKREQIEMKTELVRILSDLELFERERRRLKERIKELENEVKELDELEPKVKEYEELLRIIEDKKDIEDKYRYIESEISRLKNKINEITSLIENETQRVMDKAKHYLPFEPPNDINAISDAVKTLLDALRRQEENLRQKEKTIQSLIASATTRIRELEDKLLKLTTARGVCPLCGRPLSDDERVKLIARLRDDKRRLENELLQLQRKGNEIESQLAKVSELRNEIEALLQDVEVTVRSIRLRQQELSELNSRLRELKSSLLEVYAAYKEYKEAKDRAERLHEYVVRYQVLIRRAKDLERYKEDLEKLEASISSLVLRAREILDRLGLREPPQRSQLEEEIRQYMEEVARVSSVAQKLPELERRQKLLMDRINSIKKEIEALDQLREEYERLRKYVEAKREELSLLEREVRGLYSEVAELDARLRVIKEREKEFKEAMEKIREIEEYVEKYRKVINVLEKIRRALSPNGIPRIIREAARNRLEQCLRDILYAFNIDFTDIRLDEDYNVYVVTRNGEKSVQMLSGGERIALAIAYRLAIARLVGESIETLIMDEPTVHLDEEKRRELINIIRYGLESTGLAQLVVITHERELEEAADKVIEVQQVNGVSKVLERTPGSQALLVES
ncbi:DNA double-strand break repair ATPase Rad50 [Pyrofollis japonicus]|uniref:AAA family ATPase n=1 Tax=Pyrofollis japonicus TaxID=3060460 RepID=UPI00295A90C9|nr:AAA family ATPase [Pyrofollis japonicus]BEP17568.1 DNA double-strand break repair ATPase Rad50 [Pyrofollis japonicus]